MKTRKNAQKRTANKSQCHKVHIFEAVLLSTGNSISFVENNSLKCQFFVLI